MATHSLLTFRDLQLEVLRWIDEVSDTDQTLTLVKEALNRSHRQVLASRNWPFMLWPNEETLTTVAGQRKYALKPGVSRLLTLWDTEARQFVPMISRRAWEEMSVDRTEQVDPSGIIYGDVWPVAAQPSSASTLTIVSSSSNDVTQSVQVTGLDGNGEHVSETLSAAGTTTVTGTTSFAFILSVTKVGTWAGTMTLATSGGTTLLTLTASQAAKQYPTIEFIETPRASRTYTWTAQRIPSTLVADEDVPDTPYPFSALHVYDALLDMSVYNSELGSKHQQVWQTRRDTLHKELLDSVDEVIAGSRPRFVRNLHTRFTYRQRMSL